MTIVLRNGRLIDPGLGLDEVRDIMIVDGVIATIAPNIASSTGTETYDMRGRIIAPGFLDMHVHLREPGFEHKETIGTGCLAAASGGFTAVCCMPNTNPAIDEASVVRDVLDRAKKSIDGLVDVYPVAAVTKNREGKELSPMLELADAGLLLAYHDRSDGGVAITLLEMAFAGRAALDIDFGVVSEPVAALFSEELGAVLQMRR